MSDVVAVIPARAGSKGVIDKNIKLLAGYPLIAYSVVAARLASSIDRIIVSTDSEEYASIACKYGAEVPFLRPEEISGDNSTDYDFIKHLLDWLLCDESKLPKYLVHLRPTTPLRVSSEMDRAISLMKERSDCTSLRSAHELPEPPHKMFQINQEGFFDGFFPDDPREEYYNLPRQTFPKAYHPNGYVDIIKPDFAQKTGLLYGSKMLGFVTPLTVEVDMPEDFELLEYRLSKYGNPVYEYLLKKFPEA